MGKEENDRPIYPNRGTYPPPRHLLRDLGIVIERSGEDIVSRLSPRAEIADAGGRTRIGVLATLVDVIAGEKAIRSVLPNWTATSNLSVYVDEIPTSAPIEATAQILRAGRQNVVLEARLRNGSNAAEFGVAQMAFAILPSRSDVQTTGHWAEASNVRTEFATADSGFSQPILEAMGIEFRDRESASATLAAVPSYLTNSLGALQGGAVAILLEAAAERFAAQELGAGIRVRSMAIHYLKLGRVGPIHAATRTIARTAGGLLVHVTLFDEGANDALLTVATIQVDEASAVV